MSPLGRVLIFAVGSFLLVAAPANAKGPDGKGSSGQQAAPKKAPPTKAAPKKAAPPKKAAESELRADWLKGREVDVDMRPATNLVFLIEESEDVNEYSDLSR